MKIFSEIIKKTKHTLQMINEKFNNIKDNSSDQFSCFYPGTQSLFFSYLFNRIFSRIKLNKNTKNKVFKLNEQGIVIYTGKYKTLFEFLYFNTVFKKAALPYPEIGFDFNFFLLQPVKKAFKIILWQIIYFFQHLKFKTPYASGYLTTELTRGRSGFVYLIEGDEFYKRFVKSKPDPLFLLIQLQNKISRPVFFVPSAIVFSSKPVRSTPGFLEIFLGSNEKPGKIRRLAAIFRNPRKIHVDISEPVNLREFLNRPDIRDLDSVYQAGRLRSYLTDLLNRQRRSVTGPLLKSREELTEEILTRAPLQNFMKAYARENGKTIEQVHKKADSHIKEIAANYNLNIILAMKKILIWVFKNIFEGLVVDEEGLDRIKEDSKKAPLVLVPCHKSHLDYLLLSFVMFNNNMPCPHIAAGKNLSFWPLGPIFRGGGAFFLRRTFKGAVLYSRIFAAYIEKLLAEGFNLEIFIEGGRSRTGKLLSPKLGFLSIIIKAYRRKACEDLLFVPVYVGYDRVLEEDTYLYEIEGGKKKPENISGLIKARKFLKKKYGKVYIKFGETISLESYIRDKGFLPSQIDENTHKALCRTMGYKLVNAINQISIVTPHGIIAGAVLNSFGNRFTKKELMEKVESYMNILTFFNAELADTLIIDSELAFKTVLENFISRKFIEFADEDEDEIEDTTRFILKDNKRPVLDYYKNNAISYFIPASYTAVAILETDTFQFSSQSLLQTHNFLEKFFIDEFSFNEEITGEYHISQCLKAFMEDGIIVPANKMEDRYNLTSEGFRKLKCFSGFLKPFLESYKTALEYFEKYPEDKHASKDRIKKIQSLGIKMYKRQEIQLKESLSKINYINACRFFMKNGVTGMEDKEEITRYKETIEKLLKFTTF
ncbi:MAG: 1-acyl-sn-glycerol-3-phosphate acyltransferase [Thermodesulfobacteriota bacterium]|nr:1-acyl-sn-glycerol-3-phosphate acyltransferase [Thermodesulfobacteriota bacterium]